MKKTIIALTLLITYVCAFSVHAVLRIEITQGAENATPIAVVPFQWEAQDVPLPIDVAEIIGSNLQRSGQFKAFPHEDMPAKPHEGKTVRFQNWRAVGVDHLVVGKLREKSDDKFAIDFQLLDVITGKQLAGYSIPSTRKELRSAVHHVSDIIYEALTGDKGAFNTRIAYVTVQHQGRGKAQYNLQIADTDGHNAKTILKSYQPIMSPSWSPDARRLAYVSFENKHSEIFIQSILTGQRESVASFKGINGAPVWSPDGRKLALTLSRGGNPDIFILNLSSKKLSQVTRHWSIDTEPVWSADGDSLVFTSGRSGSPQLYEVSLNQFIKQKPKRITFEGKYNASPAISPDGRTVAMVHSERGKYRIAVLNRKSGHLSVLTDGRLDESPSYAPNGSMLLYASEDKGQGVLAAVSVDGRVKQRLILLDADIREPTWAPFPNRR